MFNIYLSSDDTSMSIRRRFLFVIFKHYVWSFTFYIVIMNGNLTKNSERMDSYE